MSNEQKLSEYDFIVCVDTSGSMGEKYRHTTRWKYAQETVESLCRALEQYDSDGIDLVFFGGRNISKHEGTTTEKLQEVFKTKSPMGSTPLAEALEMALQCAGKSSKKDLVLVLTDGIPDDQLKAAEVIKKASNKLENDEDLNFLFIQVGDDKQATSYLKSLDDSLTGCKFDIVDAKTIDEVESFSSFQELLINAIND